MTRLATNVATLETHTYSSIGYSIRYDPVDMAVGSDLCNQSCDSEKRVEWGHLRELDFYNYCWAEENART